MLSSGKQGNELSPFLSPLSVKAFAIGTSVGWGLLIVTSNTYLKQAGPLGSVIGLLIGMVVMLLVCRNYHYVANQYPDGIGIISYTKNIFGYDRAFLVSWFAFLLHIAMFWANATAVPLFVRYIFGDLFCFGQMYTFFGYDVYLGEILLTIAVIWLTALLMINSKRLTATVMVVLVALFLIGITVCFITAIVRYSSGNEGINPLFVPGKMPSAQVMRITFISPWAFIGFESVTFSAKEFNFKKSKLHRILVTSVIITTALYIFVTLLSVTAYPDRYGNWLEYINDLDNLSGIEAMPVFYAANHYLGMTGLVFLFVSLFALVVTSLISNMWALSRLMYAAGQNSILSEKFARLNQKEIPARAIIAVAVISSFIPLIGRSAIGWIVDVTTIIATFLYGFISAAAMKRAKLNKDKREFVTGLIVLVIMAIFGAAIFTPGLSSDSLAPETYLLFILWSIFGMIFFHRVIAKDRAQHFGKAIIVWVVLISLIVFLGIVWMSKIENSATQEIITALKDYHAGNASPEILAMSEDAYIAQLNRQLDTTTLISRLAVLVLFAISVGGFIVNYRFMKKHGTELENEVAAKAEHIIKMQNDLVIGMATMVESRDNSTGGHIRRTSDLVRLLVEEMKKDESLSFSDTYYDNVIKAAAMHDLGKIAVDDAILRKPGRFTPEEYDIMKTHSKEGARIVAEIIKNTDDEEFKRIAENMAHYHHERVDGSGYPDQLKQDDIPLEARIMAIADVYDALVSKRVYKEKISFEEADRIILEGMGTQFDDKLEKYYKQARPRFEDYCSSENV